MFLRETPNIKAKSFCSIAPTLIRISRTSSAVSLEAGQRSPRRRVPWAILSELFSLLVFQERCRLVVHPRWPFPQLCADSINGSGAGPYSSSHTTRETTLGEPSILIL